MLYGFVGFKVPDATPEEAAAEPASDDLRQRAPQ
jgi:hypothetical protein